MATTKIITEVTDLNAASSTNGLKMPTGTAYSGTPTDGMVRNDTTGSSQGSASTMQHYNGTEWKNFENLPSSFSANYLVVAGGGSGGSQYGGGGGGGGLKTTTTYGGSGAPLSLLKSTAYNVTVGAGGAGVIYSTSPSNNGENSIFDSVTATGGGYGGYFFGGSTPSTGGNSGGSGGGGGMGLTAGVSTAGGSGTSGQGFDGGDGYRGSGTDYNGGGGGGAAAAGQDGNTTPSATGGAGGAGLEVNIIGGTGNYYAGGGGGSGNTSGGAGGIGGGGSAGGAAVDTKSGIINTGGGGGGLLPIVGPYSGSGGSGIVILRYPTSSVSSYAVTGTLDTTADTAYPIANTAYYKLNGDALDSSGNGYNGTATSVTYAAGRYGQAGVFNGSGSIIEYPLKNGFLNTRTTASVSLWFKCAGLSEAGILFTDYANTSMNIDVYIDTSGKIQGTTRYSNNSLYATASTNSYDDNNWHHLVVVIDQSGNTRKHYVDGNLIYTGTLPSGAWNGAATQKITSGRLFAPQDGLYYNNFVGSIDQVRIFNTAITAANVTSLYNEGTVNESTDGTDSILQFIGGTGTVTFS